MFNYRWNLSDGYPAKGIEKHDKTVFGTFICGGGSTMGYKLAGYNHLGGVEIDPKLAQIYKLNHDPKYFYLEDIREFNKRDDLPKELYDLDFLDGSPPCSTFSMAGSREDAWRKEKKFREGQSDQMLDDLVYVYCETIKKLRPKVFLLENVKGMILGNAKIYTKNIVKIMEEAGYKVQIFLLNAASMGVPQRRERVFIIGTLLKKKLLTLSFDERSISVGEATNDLPQYGTKLTDLAKEVWTKTKIGDSASKVMKGSWFSRVKLHPDKPSNTITGGATKDMWHWEKPYFISQEIARRLSSFPDDYQFNGEDSGYICGMSVPPVMTAQIANQIYKQWLQ